jgi:hypothetical protein
LNVFVHELGLCLAEFPATDGKPTEPQGLKAALAELTDHYPMLRLFTADALFTQRPLARVILAADRQFSFAVKDNHPDLLEAVRVNICGRADHLGRKLRKAVEVHRSPEIVTLQSSCRMIPAD